MILLVVLSEEEGPILNVVFTNHNEQMLLTPPWKHIESWHRVSLYIKPCDCSLRRELKSLKKLISTFLLRFINK